MLNKIIIMGRLTADPELKQTQSGKSVVSFTMACERDFGGQNGQKEYDFINCVAWEKKAEFVAKYFSKGRMIVIDGRLTTRNYETNNGKRTATEVICENMYFGDSKTQQANTVQDGFTQSGFTAPDDGDLPF